MHQDTRSCRESVLPIDGCAPGYQTCSNSSVRALEFKRGDRRDLLMQEVIQSIPRVDVNSGQRSDNTSLELRQRGVLDQFNQV